MTTPTTPAPVFTSSFPFDPDRVGAAAVYCSDGRYGEQMDEFLHKHLGLPEYDRVAMPGGAAALASHFVTLREEMALDRQLRFLIAGHALHTVVLIAHQDCGYYKQIRLRQKTLLDQQTADLQKAAERIRTYAPNLTLHAFFARRENATVHFDPIPL